MLLVCLVGAHRQAHAWGEVNKSSQVGFEVAANNYCSVGPSFGTTAQGAATAMANALNAANCQNNSSLRTVWGVNSCAGPYGDGSYRCPLTRNQCFKDPQTGTCNLPGPIEVETLAPMPKNSEFCPNSSTEKAGRCECQLGFKPSGNSLSCEPYYCPGGDSYTKMTQPDIKVDNVGAICSGGCETMPSSWSTGPNGQIYAQWPFKYSGKTCGGGSPTVVDTTGDKGFEELPSTCGPTKCPGTFNGQSLCVPCAAKTLPPSSTTNPTPVNSSQPGVDGVPGAQSKKDMTSCDGATCTTSTIYYNSTGDKVGEKTQEKPKESFCQENPGLAICKEGKWGGSCDAGFTCDGDAIQCAMARKQHESACKLFTEPSDELKATVQSLKGTGQAVGAFDETFSVSAGFTPMTTAGCAVQDFPVSFGLFSLTVPLGTFICPHLGTIRAVLSAFGALFFVMIVFVRGD
jgi:hypothetical protein